MNLRQTLSQILILDPKYRSELDFWKQHLNELVLWYRGEISSLYGEPAPKSKAQVACFNEKDSAILTWLEHHQKKKYLQDLQLKSNAFSGLKVLDIGSGPFPSALVFKNCELYCLDPLWPYYLQIGYPTHYYDKMRIVSAKAESIPLGDNYIDAIISVNAIDHVDSFLQVSKEIRRVLKKNGKLAMHIHYHEKTATEPEVLNDNIVQEAFSWCQGWHKVTQSKKKRGYKIDSASQIYTLWSNVHAVS